MSMKIKGSAKVMNGQVDIDGHRNGLLMIVVMAITRITMAVVREEMVVFNLRAPPLSCSCCCCSLLLCA